MSGERALLENLRARLPAAPPGQTWIGDDAAVLDGGLLLATDMLVEGVHFDLAWSTPADVGWKALAVSVSDIAAMGGTPTAAVASVALPPRAQLADGLLDGIAEAAASLHCPLVGGDTTAGPELVVSVAVVGRAPASGAVLRSGAQPGDLLFVTGALGGAVAALEALRTGRRPDPRALDRLRRPVPRVAAGHAVVAAGGTAMIDISDGLASEVRHLAQASATGARVDLGAVPLAPGASPDDALGGGDDYELLFAAPNRGAVVEAFAAAELPEPVRIGEMAGEALVVTMPDGSTHDLPDAGFEHDVS